MVAGSDKTESSFVVEFAAAGVADTAAGTAVVVVVVVVMAVVDNVAVDVAADMAVVAVDMAVVAGETVVLGTGASYVGRLVAEAAEEHQTNLTTPIEDTADG